MLANKTLTLKKKHIYLIPLSQTTQIPLQSKFSCYLLSFFRKVDTPAGCQTKIISAAPLTMSHQRVEELWPWQLLQFLSRPSQEPPPRSPGWPKPLANKLWWAWKGTAYPTSKVIPTKKCEKKWQRRDIYIYIIAPIYQLYFCNFQHIHKKSLNKYIYIYI